MSKNKNNKLINSLSSVSTQAGMLMMAAATTVGMLDSQNHQRIKVIVPNQPIFAYEEVSTDSNNPIRREREESAPHYISYNVTQRTPGRHGKI